MNGENMELGSTGSRKAQRSYTHMNPAAVNVKPAQNQVGLQV